MSVTSSTSSSELWTTRRLLEWMTGYFNSHDVESARLVGELLLAHVIGCERMRLYMEVDRPASPDELATLRDLVKRAGRHEPVQYLIGEAWFFTRPFRVDRSTLIPRPSTETLVEWVLRELQAHPDEPASDRTPSPRIADIGTGTGCIAISLAAQIDDAVVVATDVQSDALQLAAENAGRHDVSERIDFRPGDGLAALGDERFDVLCSNPPYISDDEWAEVPPNVRDYEPASALRGGPDGLHVICPLLERAADHLHPGGRLAIEIASSQRDAVMDLAGRNDRLVDVEVLKDHEGLWRVLIARRVAD